MEPLFSGWGLGVVLVSVPVDGSDGPLAACADIGLFASVAAAVLALAAIASDGGVVEKANAHGARRLLTLAPISALAIAADLCPSRGPLAWWANHRDLWVWTNLAVAAVVLMTAIESTVSRRRLELGPLERARAARSVFVVVLVFAMLVTLFAHVRSETVLRFALASCAACTVAISLQRDALRVGRLTRRAVVLAVAGGVVALAGASAASERVGEPWVVTVVACLLSLAVGIAGPALERPLRPVGGAWLDGFVEAAERAARADPDEAIRQALVALRAPLGLGHPSPELWTFGPTVRSWVDAAGYLHESAGELPPSLIAVTAAEPDSTLRTQVLEALQVRRPDLRPLADWMIARGALLAILLACDGEVHGLLVIPHGERRDTLTLEEVRTLRRAADRLGAACHARATACAMRLRARDAVERSDTAQAQANKLLWRRAIDDARHSLAAARLARPARVGVYSAASRLALESLEARTSRGSLIVVHASSGVDPVPYLARAHLAGVRRCGPFVVVDSTDARERDFTRWSDPQASPLILADGGMLVVLDVAALPPQVQRLLARAHRERCLTDAPATAFDVQLAMTAVLPPSGTPAPIDTALAALFDEQDAVPIRLPRLHERKEDLRSVLTDAIAREGLRTLGMPVGIEQPAYALLCSYDFPGDDAELVAIAARLVAGCDGQTVRLRDVERLAIFHAEPFAIHGPLGAGVHFPKNPS
jgi:hypothetical protein